MFRLEGSNFLNDHMNNTAEIYLVSKNYIIKAEQPTVLNSEFVVQTTKKIEMRGESL